MTDTIYAWSQNALDNESSDATLSWLEGQPPEEVNDAGRAMMRRVAQLIADLAPKRTSAGTGNAYTVTSSAAGATYRDGELVTFVVDRDNSGAATLNVNGRGAKAWRPAVGVDFTARSLLANVAVTAFYRSATDEFISPGTGYYVQQMASGVALQSVTARLPQIGDLTISYAPTPGPGRIRLTEATQSILKSAYPELNSYLSGISYPWGSTATHFSLPPAAGYALRFAATSGTIDTGGARAAGSVQGDQNKTATIPATGLTASTTVAPHSHPFDALDAVGNNGTGSGGGFTSVSGPTGKTTSTTTATATTTLAGSATLPGGDEVRVKNVAFHLDVVASTALAAAQIAVFGFPYQWDTGTVAANPGAGRVRGDHATLASITTLYVSTTDGLGVDLTAWLASRPAGSIIDLSKVGAQANRISFTVSGAPSSATGYVAIPVTVGVAAGTLSMNDQMALEFGSAGVPGGVGVAGSDGGVKFTFDSSTTMAAPAAGGVRFNSATLASATQVAIANTTADAGNPSVSGWINAWDDSTTTGNRGQLLFRKASTGATVAIFNVASLITDNASWLTFTVQASAVPGTFANGDALLVAFSRSGDKGADGVGSGSVTSVAAGGGLSATGVGATGGTVTVAGTLTAIQAVNAQTGTTYSVAASDHAKLLTLSSATAVAVTLPQAIVSFAAGFYIDVANLNSGVATLAPTTGTINGAASFVINRFQSARIVSDGANWQVMQGSGLRGQTVTVASAATTDIGAIASHRASITGTTTITSLGAVPNQIRLVTFAGALTLTHNATTLLLPGGASILTAANDAAVLSSDASGNWTCLAYTKANGQAVASSGGGGAPSSPQGRLTLTSGAPVLTATVSGATTVYYAPYTGQYVPLYNGSTWEMTDAGGELSQATTDSAKSPAGCAANSNYDLFVWSDSGTIRCTRGPAWTSSTARGTGAGTTELERVNGVSVNKVAITNGPAANRGTYVGTIRTNGSSQVDWIYGASATGGTAGFLGVWNMYNRVDVATTVTDSTDTWSYNSSTIRAANASTTNRVSFVCGLAEDHFYASYNSPGVNNGAGTAAGIVGIGYDVTNAFSGRWTWGGFGAASLFSAAGGEYMASALGFHFVQACESAGNTNTYNFYGDNGSGAGTPLGGLLFRMRM